MLTALFPILGRIGERVASSLFPNVEDEVKRGQVAREIVSAVMSAGAEIETAAASVVRTEAASNHWLAANWRPITALIFVGLVVARWFGWSAPGISEAEYLSLFDLIKIMIGGYVASRGLEKIVPAILQKIGGNNGT